MERETCSVCGRKKVSISMCPVGVMVATVLVTMFLVCFVVMVYKITYS